MNTPSPASKSGFGALRALAGKRPAQERCELCNLALATEHPHLLARSSGRIACACEACAILFSHREEGAKFARIPRRIRRLGNFRITDAEWNGLMLPIDMAFFVPSSSAGRVIAYYPGPAGSTESQLRLESWEDLARNNAALANLSPDVEALLVNRTRGQREYYIAPLDECYKLTGLIRIHWRGLSGGDKVWEEIGRFFENLGQRAVEEAYA